MNVLKNLKVGALLLMALLPMAVGCGDAHRNDQGVSFLNAGWCADFECKTGLAYMRSCLSILGEATLDNLASPGALIVLQNNLSGEYIRLQRVHHSYHVYGASIQPPDTSVAANGVILPSNGQKDDDEMGGSTLPGNLTEQQDGDEIPVMGQILKYWVPFITPDVASFISLNRNAMPEPPFTMVVESYAEGVTSAGRRIYSNTGYMEFQVYADEACLPGVDDDDDDDDDETEE